MESRVLQVPFREFCYELQDFIIIRFAQVILLYVIVFLVVVLSLCQKNTSKEVGRGEDNQNLLMKQSANIARIEVNIS